MDGVAGLHAASWRRFYRGAYSDAYLDGDVVADRREVWSSRLAESGVDSATILAEVGGEVAGFAHVKFDEDPAWGALLDNLHVSPAHQRQGIGSGLISRAARAVVERAAAPSLYLWVLELNTAAQAFYAAHGGRCAERALVRPPGGVPGRLRGQPVRLRFVWADARLLDA